MCLLRNAGGECIFVVIFIQFVFIKPTIVLFFVFGIEFYCKDSLPVDGQGEDS